MANEQLVSIVKNMAEFGKVAELVGKADGTYSKVIALASLSDEVIALMNIDALALKEEFANLDDKGIEDLKAVFDHNFDLENDLMEEIIESSFDIMIGIADNISDAIELAKKIKGK